MRAALAALLTLVAVAAAVAIAMGRESAPAPRNSTAPPSPLATADPADTARSDPEVARGRVDRDYRVDRRLVRVSGLVLPIEGAVLPTDPELLPNAERAYRGGWHEGIDFPAKAGTPVRAVANGVVLRIDRDFTDWPQADEQAALDEAARLGYTPEATLDRIRGRQVWIDHGGGVVSRYAHLSSVAALSVGDAVQAAEVIGAVGSSGYPEGGPHLHLEIRVGPGYLGDGLSGDRLQSAIAAAFD